MLMNTIDILIEGYATVTETGWVASGTSTLITVNPVILSESEGSKKDSSPAVQNDNKTTLIIVDPGCNRDLLLEELGKRNLSINDIDYVFLTHHHLDHAMNAGIFPNAKVIDEEAVYTQDHAIEGVVEIPATDITVIKTPGHEYAHAALLVPTKDGTVAVAGDNFWWTTEEEQKIDVEKIDDFAEKMDELIASRKKILDLADWIIPGHGKMMKVTR